MQALVNLREKPPFPEVVDNTMRSDFILCPTKWMYSFLFQLTGGGPNVHLHAGGTFARGLEVARKFFWDEGQSVAVAKTAGLQAMMEFYGDFVPVPTKTGDKSLDNVIKAYDSYLQRYPLDKDIIKPLRTADGKHMIEFNFAIPSEVINPSTGTPILIGGRADLIGKIENAIYVTDEKTTGQLGEQWAAQWDLDSQFMGYTDAARYHGFEAVGAVVRGIGLLKTKITHGEVIRQYNQWELDRWRRQFNKDLQKMVNAYNAFDFDMALSRNACNAYGGCTFKTLCQSPTPEQWLNQYRIRVWNPLAKDFGENLKDQAVPRLGQEESINLEDLLPK